MSNKELAIKNEILIYEREDLEVEVRLEGDSLWLSQAKLAELFAVKRPAITKHLSNIFKSNELASDSVCSILEHTAADGKRYKTKHYNLNTIILVGYRGWLMSLYRNDKLFSSYLEFKNTRILNKYNILKPIFRLQAYLQLQYKITLNCFTNWTIISSNTPTKPLNDAQIGGFFYAYCFSAGGFE